MEHNQNPVIGHTALLYSQIRIEADVCLWQSFKMVLFIHTSLCSHSLW